MVKHTLVLQLLDMLKVNSQYITADGAGGSGELWLAEALGSSEANRKHQKKPGILFWPSMKFQKIDNWSEISKETVG